MPENVNQQFADAALIRTIELQSVATWLLTDYLARLDKLQKEIIASVASNDGGATEVLVLEVMAKIDAVRKELESRTEEDFDTLAEIQAEDERNNFAIFGIALATFAPVKASEIEITGIKLNEWLKRTFGDLEIRTLGVIRRGANDPLAKQIQRIKGSSDLAQEAEVGIVEPTKRSLEAMTRSAVEAVASQTREKATEELEAIPKAQRTIRYAYRHHSILDAVTSSICRERANKLWSSDKKPIKHSLPFALPPLHPNCRSVISIELLDDDPAKDEKFAEWMNRQTDETKKRVFGSKALKLWYDKKISDSDLIRSKEKQLTFEDLRKRNGT